ncbi:DUF3307 domain-containing protein [Hoeflea sp. YIM 152468]|uniref:DUF3307 domain-containing protein n=1 Tax=Hoeflea sp. YIM 152468 TaxID=3031759 RepID=UPI0023DB9247|nr:DUF3307 domain-containing protein [Hoeflea sp. YIM 152468]MDF1610435.1 DUF3307 domain-containing protein [Hoeflea sp. YIM 152468]
MATETFALLLIAHLLGDFTLQTEFMAMNKKRISVLALHILIITVLGMLAIGQFDWKLLGTLALTHFLIDFIKARNNGSNLTWFVADQSAHVAVLVALSILLPIDVSQSLHLGLLDPDSRNAIFKVIIHASGLILCVTTGAYVTGLAVKPFTDEIGTALNGLKTGGRIIGQLERFMVFMFTLTGNPTGIGFLIAAKSILRFGDITNPDQRKIAEYVIIGSLISFAWAITVSQLTIFASKHITAG